MKKLLIITLLFVGGISFAQEGVTLNRSTTLKIAEVPPTWPGCEGSISQKDHCFKTKLINHIIKGFKFPANHKRGTKVIVDLLINKEGKPEIKNMEGGPTALQNEIKRQILSMPIVEPGHSGGKPQVREYKLPITF